MKLSCLPVSYFDEIINGQMSVEQWSCQASDLDLDAIDLSVLLLKRHDFEYLEKIRKDIEAVGMRVAVLNTYPDFTNPDPVIRQKEQSKLQKYMDSAAILNAEMVRVTAGQAHPQTSRKVGVKWAIEGIVSYLEQMVRISCNHESAFFQLSDSSCSSLILASLWPAFAAFLNQ